MNTPKPIPAIRQDPATQRYQYALDGIAMGYRETEAEARAAVDQLARLLLTVAPAREPELPAMEELISQAAQLTNQLHAQHESTPPYKKYRREHLRAAFVAARHVLTVLQTILRSTPNDGRGAA